MNRALPLLAAEANSHEAAKTNTSVTDCEAEALHVCVQLLIDGANMP